ncbi:hypothetical protein Aduo_002413 [Ancylostoma duodenale]
MNSLFSVAVVKVEDEEERHFENEDHRRYTVQLETFFFYPKQRLRYAYYPRTINIYKRRGEKYCDVELYIGESYVVVGSMGVYDFVQRYDDLEVLEKWWLRKLADDQAARRI